VRQAARRQVMRSCGASVFVILKDRGIAQFKIADQSVTSMISKRQLSQAKVSLAQRLTRGGYQWFMRVP
jgi:hypothetical protein